MQRLEVSGAVIQTVKETIIPHYVNVTERGFVLETENYHCFSV